MLKVADDGFMEYFHILLANNPFIMEEMENMEHKKISINRKDLLLMV